MPTKKKTKSPSRKRTPKAKGFSFEKALGLGGGVFAGVKLSGMDMLADYDPKLVAIGKVFLGDWLPKQKFAQGIGSPDLMRAAGDGLAADGMRDLLVEFEVISGVGALEDDDILAVAIEGIDDESLSGDDDIDSINEDILGDDDLDAINEDVLGVDDDDDDF